MANATTTVGSPCWEESSTGRSGLLQLLWSGFHWMVQKLTEPTGDAEDVSSYNDEDEEGDDDSSIEDEDNKKRVRIRFL